MVQSSQTFDTARITKLYGLMHTRFDPVRITKLQIGKTARSMSNSHGTKQRNSTNSRVQPVERAKQMNPFDDTRTLGWTATQPQPSQLCHLRVHTTMDPQRSISPVVPMPVPTPPTVCAPVTPPTMRAPPPPGAPIRRRRYRMLWRSFNSHSTGTTARSTDARQARQRSTLDARTHADAPCT